MSRFLTREVAVYFPYPEERPEALLRLTAPDEGALADQLASPLMRVAKRGDEVIGVYVLCARDDATYEIINLAVAHDFRRRGLGGWLVGHAIGVAESKGARTVRAAGYPGTLFARAGFSRDDAGLVLTLTPE